MVLHTDGNCYRLTVNLFQNTADPTIVLLVQINKMIALFILFVLIVLGKFVQTP